MHAKLTSPQRNVRFGPRNLKYETFRFRPILCRSAMRPISVISTTAANPRKRSIRIDKANRVTLLISDQRWVIPKAPRTYASEFCKA